MEKGWIDDRGIVWHQQRGPLNGRAAGPGYRLLESERTQEDLEFGEDMLYTAAVQAGWLTGEEGEVIDVPDVQITVSVALTAPTLFTALLRRDQRSWPGCCSATTAIARWSVERAPNLQDRFLEPGGGPWLGSGCGLRVPPASPGRGFYADGSRRCPGQAYHRPSNDHDRDEDPEHGEHDVVVAGKRDVDGARVYERVKRDAGND